MAIAVMTITLSGCVRVNNDGTPKEGFVYNYLALPAEHILDFIAKFVGGYGWALIVLTVIVRMILLPVMINQMTKSTKMQEKNEFNSSSDEEHSKKDNKVPKHKKKKCKFNKK